MKTDTTASMAVGPSGEQGMFAAAREIVVATDAFDLLAAIGDGQSGSQQSNLLWGDSQIFGSSNCRELFEINCSEFWL